MAILLLALLPLAAAGFLLTGSVYQQLGLRRDWKLFPPAGGSVSAGGCIFHVHKQGQGSPVVVLESGLAGSSLSWTFVSRKVAEFTAVCSYDRAGFGWSGPAGSPRLLANVVEELHGMLTAADFSTPCVLVGHSYGGLIVRAFAHLYPDKTAGVILLDPVSTSYWADCTVEDGKRLQLGIKLARRGAILAQFGIVRLALDLLVSGRRFLPQLVSSASARKATPFLARLTGEIRKLPPTIWPVIQAQWSRPGGFLALAGYLDLLPANARFAERTKFTCRVPLTILSAATASQAELLERDGWVAQSCLGQHIRLPDSGHWIQVDQPAAVAEAISDMVRNLRNP